MDDLKLVCFDLDKTLISHNSWRELSFGLGISYDEDKKMYEDYHAGKFTYDEWNAKCLERYLEHENATRAGITRILSSFEYNLGARELVADLKLKGYLLCLVSGSIDILVNIVAKDLGIEYAKANNTFVFDDGGRLFSIHSHGDDTKAKADHLEAFCDMLGIRMDQSVCIGDGENDIEMFRRTKHGVTFKGSLIESEAWRVVDSLQEIKNLLPAIA